MTSSVNPGMKSGIEKPVFSKTLAPPGTAPSRSTQLCWARLRGRCARSAGENGFLVTV